MKFDNSEYYVIDIHTEESPQPSLIDELGSLYTNIKSKRSETIAKSDDDWIPPREPKKKKKSKKNKIKISDVFDVGTIEDDVSQEEQEKDLLDIDELIRQREEDDDNENIINEQKKNYKKLKKDDNDFKKEFAEELTLLYDLLDETSKFGKALEKDLSSLKGSKVRGISKYTNELAELILSSKQNKLNILKEISGVKKTIADLKIKNDTKNKTKDEDSNSPERLASAYFKNILSHGRGNFINAYTSDEYIDQGEDEHTALINQIENARSQSAEDEDLERYSKLLMDRLDNSPNPYRSSEGTKYIEYENRNVKLYVKKCIDTGEWHFVAIDKNNCQIDDYPLPSKRDAGRMKFSDDGSYATDAKGRIYNVIEYYLPNDDYDE